VSYSCSIPRTFNPRNLVWARNLQSKGIHWGERKVSEENNSATLLRNGFVHLGLPHACNSFISIEANDNNHLHKP
jgi:hypothetical protein